MHTFKISDYLFGIIKKFNSIFFLLIFVLVSVLLLSSCSLNLDAVDDPDDNNYNQIVIESITIDNTTIQNKFEVGDTLPSGIKLNVIYSDGTTDKVDVEDSMISGFSTEHPGNFVLFITYSSKNISFPFVVLDLEIPTVYLTSLELDLTTFNTEYYLYDAFPADVKLNATFSDDTTSKIKVLDEMVSGFDTTTVGVKNISVTYLDRQVYHVINVYDEIQSIYLDKSQFKDSYSVNEALVLDSINLELLLKDQTTRYVQLTDKMIESTFNTNIAGNILLRVNFRNQSTEIIIQVNGTFTLNDFNITFDTVTETYNIIEYIGNSEDVVIPGLINNCKIGYIAPSIFADHINNIKNLTIPFIGPTANNDEMNEKFNYLYYIDDEEEYIDTYISVLTILTILPNYSSIIYPGSFTYESKLKKVILPEGILEIGEYAFAYSSIIEVELPKSLMTIRTAAFTMLLQLKYIEIPDNVELIESHAFSSPSFYIIKLPTFFSCEIADFVFHSVYFIIDDDSFNEYSNDEYFSKYESHFIKQSEISVYENSFYVTSSKLLAYAGNDHIVNIPSFITEIGDFAFYGNTSIKQVNLPDNLIRIGNHAFYFTTLTKIALPDGIKELGNYALNDSINFLTLPSSVNKIGTSIFNGWRIIVMSPTPITLNNSINAHFIIVPNDAVYEYKNQWKDKTDIIYPMSFLDIEFTIVDGVLINYNGIGGDVTIPNGVEYIGEDVFSISGISEDIIIRSVTLPASVIEISINAFYYNEYLSSVVIDANSSLETIGETAFYKCTNLTDFSWVDSIEYIGNRAFEGCMISDLVFTENSNLAFIGYNAFSDCSDLQNVILPASLDELESNIFLLDFKINVIYMRAENLNEISTLSHWWNLCDTTPKAVFFDVVWDYHD
ncbi:MAG: leucine-rich repeat protein [Christensenellaceae bacterium]|jgi:hypothetical protein|nr:leucine-rich repeat protein [Christensenellaceae bacterium]